jgi:hypothetical protein
MTKEDKNYGKAYAFLNSKASRKILPLVIEDAREMYNVPQKLELTITDGPEKLKADERLRPHIDRAFHTGMRYVLEAKCEGITNEKTADELKSILNGIYLGSKEVDKSYSAFVLHEDNKGRYVIQEQDNFLQSRD